MTQVHTDIDRIGRRFYGRERPLRKIVSGLLRTPPISYSLVGACAIGKSALLSQLAADDGPLSAPTFAQWRPQSFQQGDNVEVVQIDCHWALAESCLLDALYCALCEQLKPQVGSQKWWAQLEEEEPSALVRLTHIVRQIRREQRRLIVLIDNVEQLFKQSSSSTNGLAALWPLLHELAIVTTSPQPLHDLAPASDTTSFFSELTQLFVGTLEPAAAAAWLADLATQTPGLDSLQAILLELTGAHPFLLHCVAPVLAEVEHYLAPGEMISEGHGALIRLRLAEHARPLFARQWLQLQTPPEPLEAAVIFELLTRLTQPTPGDAPHRLT